MFLYAGREVDSLENNDIYFYKTTLQLVEFCPVRLKY